jgi:hypothetical protein
LQRIIDDMLLLLLLLLLPPQKPYVTSFEFPANNKTFLIRLE